jgi:hypothetical protein
MPGWSSLRGLLLSGGQVGENAHDVALLHDQELFAIGGMPPGGGGMGGMGGMDF